MRIDTLCLIITYSLLDKYFQQDYKLFVSIIQVYDLNFRDSDRGTIFALTSKLKQTRRRRGDWVTSDSNWIACDGFCLGD